MEHLDAALIARARGIMVADDGAGDMVRHMVEVPAVIDGPPYGRLCARIESTHALTVASGDWVVVA
jgi:hypothetical protein